MFKHVLVALDGSTYSQAALPTAIEVAQKFDADLLVLHVSEHDRGYSVVYSTESPADATRLVGDAVRAAHVAGLTAHGELRHVAAGHVAKAIVDVAATNGVDLIVMGARGLSPVAGLFVGSVTQEVMKTTDVTVLVARNSLATDRATVVGNAEKA